MQSTHSMSRPVRYARRNVAARRSPTPTFADVEPRRVSRPDAPTWSCRVRGYPAEQEQDDEQQRDNSHDGNPVVPHGAGGLLGAMGGLLGAT